MADFGFDSPVVTDDDLNPALQDFLQREQGQLAELGEDALGFDDQPQPVDDDVTHGVIQPISGMEDFEETAADHYSDHYSAIAQADVLSSEPECIIKWREEQREYLEEKDSQADAEQEEWLAQAREELDSWYSKHAEHIAKTKESNRNAEAAFIEERDSTAEGQEWERVARICEFNPKNNKSTKDVSRLRSILLHLKQDGLVR